MVKEYIRKCDECGKIIENLYDFGVTTLYKQIRIGRGKHFTDYKEGTIYNLMKQESPNDYDYYGKGWSNDENKEFSFCSPKCFLKFMRNLYEKTIMESLIRIKEEKKETLDISYKEFEKRLKGKIPFFRKIQTVFSKRFFKEQGIEEANKLLKEIQKIKKELKKEVRNYSQDD